MDLLLLESFDTHLIEAAAGAGYFNADGTVNMVLIRPCNGRGYGSRIYEAAMLERDHKQFEKLPMFNNHDSVEKQRARGGNPRDPDDIRGGVLETWWEPNFITPRDAEMGFGKGAVLGRVTLFESYKEIVEKVPHLLKTSINARATSLRKGTRNGKPGMIVEGIAVDQTSSVDLVTAAGAGGELAALRESINVPDGGTPNTPCNGGSDDSADPSNGAGMTPLTDEQKAEIRSLMKAEIPGALTEALPTALTEALGSEAVVNALTEAAVTAGEKNLTTLREELTAPDEIRALAETAVRLIEAEKLPSPAAKAKMLKDFGVEGIGQRIAPGALLNTCLEAEVDSAGKVTKTCEQLLKEAVEAEAKAHRAILAEARPTTPQTWATAGGQFTAPGSTGSATGAGAPVIEAPAIVGLLGKDAASYLVNEPAAPTKTAAEAA